MPSAADFKKAFNLEPGAHIGPKSKGLIIKHAHVGHEVKQRNEKYEFPSTLSLEFPMGKEVDRSKIQSELRAHLHDKKIAYSAYGSPYACQVHGLKIKNFDAKAGSSGASFLGKATRRRDIPTIAQQKAAERAEKEGVSPSEPSPKELKDALSDDMRIIKSRFGTSHCTQCEGIIDPGELIARDKGASEPGGWVHAACAYKQRTQGGKKRKQGGARTKKQRRHATTAEA